MALRIIYGYKSIGKQENLCHLIISKENSIVIATEFAGNKDTAFTCRAPEIATEVCYKYGINPSKLIWIERFSRMSYESIQEYQDHNQGKETFRLVRFTIDNQKKLTTPLREYITPEEMREIYSLVK